MIDLFISPLFFIPLILIIIFVIPNIKVVSQNTALVVEFLGRYNRTMRAGLNIKIPILESIASIVTLRQQNFALEGKYPSKDKVIVDISTNLIFEVNSTDEGITRFTYKLQDRKQSIASMIENSLRTYIAKETHEGILEKKEELALHIKDDLKEHFEEWGMNISSFQITNVSFPKIITDAMSEVVASDQLRKAALNKGEAVKIQSIKEAEAEKERKKLQGEGIALEREAIARGFQNSVAIVKEATGQTPGEILALLTLTQYLDTLKSVGMSDNTKVLFMETGVDVSSNLMNQLTAALETHSTKK